MRAQGESMETVVVHGGERRPGPEGSVVYPIYQGTVYSVEPGTGYHDIPYIRLSECHVLRHLQYWCQYASTRGNVRTRRGQGRARRVRQDPWPCRVVSRQP